MTQLKEYEFQRSQGLGTSHHGTRNFGCLSFVGISVDWLQVFYVEQTKSYAKLG